MAGWRLFLLKQAALGKKGSPRRVGWGRVGWGCGCGGAGGRSRWPTSIRGLWGRSLLWACFRSSFPRRSAVVAERGRPAFPGTPNRSGVMGMDDAPSPSQGSRRGSEDAEARRIVTIVTVLARLAAIAYYVVRSLHEPFG